MDSPLWRPGCTRLELQPLRGQATAHLTLLSPSLLERPTCCAAPPSLLRPAPAAPPHRWALPRSTRCRPALRPSRHVTAQPSARARIGSRDPGGGFEPTALPRNGAAVFKPQLYAPVTVFAAVVGSHLTGEVRSQLLAVVRKGKSGSCHARSCAAPQRARAGERVLATCVGRDWSPLGGGSPGRTCCGPSGQCLPPRASSVLLGLAGRLGAATPNP